MNIRINNRKRLVSYLFVFILLTGLLVWFSSCTEEEEQAEPERYAFWQGDLPNHYYCLDINESPLHQVSGKPYMILEYEPLTGIPVKCEFGLSEAVNEYLDGVEYPIPEPFLQSTSLEYSGRLNLQGSVALLANWEEVKNHKELSAGGFEFWLDHSNGETLYFRFTFDGMDGEIRNAGAEWGERVSDERAFQLLRKFNSSDIGN